MSENITLNNSFDSLLNKEEDNFKLDTESCDSEYSDDDFEIQTDLLDEEIEGDFTYDPYLTFFEDTIDDRNWTNIKQTTEEKVLDTFQSETTSKSINIRSIGEAFSLFVPDDMIDIIVKYTNQKGASSESWTEVDQVEIKAFLGLLLLNGRFLETNEDPKELWNEDSRLSRPIYKATMEYDRFVSILKFIRFDDAGTRAERKKADKLAPIRQISDMLGGKFRTCLKASSNGTIDYQMLKFGKKCSFKVCMPKSADKYGIKIWTLCDAENFYCCNFNIYLGKDNVQKGLEGQHAVSRLTEFWNNSFRNVTINNCCTDIPLAEELQERNLTLIGPVKYDKDVPKALFNLNSRECFSSYLLFHSNLTLLSYVPRPKKCVVLLSSKAKSEKILGEEDYYKPEVNMLFDKTKNAVKNFEKLIKEYSCNRTVSRWPLALFLHFLDMAAYNAFVLYVKKFPDWQQNIPMKRRRRIFLEEVGKNFAFKNIQRKSFAGPVSEATFPDLKEQLLRKVNQDELIRQYNVNLTTLKGRCKLCRRDKNDNKYKERCDLCQRFVCNKHTKRDKSKFCFDCVTNYIVQGAN